MFDKFREGNFKLVLGLRVGEESKSLRRFAADFAEYTHAKLRLVNVVEAWKEHPWISTLPGENLYYSIGAQVEENAAKKAEEDLEKISKQFAQIEGVEFNVLKGDPSTAIAADAIASKSTMICVSTHKKEGLHMLAGLSTGVGLAAHANVPVMIVPEGCREFAPGERLKVLYADDLAEDSKGSLSTALELAYGLGKLDFHHVHISGESKDEMSAASQKIMEMMNCEQIELDPCFDITSLSENAEDLYKQKMLDRVGMARMLIVSRDVEYIQRVKFGKVKESLESLIEDIDPDLIIFGRHNLVHTNPIGFGHLPIAAMLSYNRPVVIAPGKKN